VRDLPILALSTLQRACRRGAGAPGWCARRRRRPRPVRAARRRSPPATEARTWLRWGRRAGRSASRRRWRWIRRTFSRPVRAADLAAHPVAPAPARTLFRPEPAVAGW